MHQLLILLVAASLVLAGCGGTMTPAATDTPIPPTPIPPTATPAPGSPYADEVVAYNPGPIPDTPWDQVGYEPEWVVGAPDAVIAPCCSGLLPLGTGGSITVKFTDNAIANGPGADLSIVGDPENDEHVRVEVSTDGVNWRDLGIVQEMDKLDLQEAGLEFATYVRVTDDAVAEASGNNSAEIDAIEALNSGPPR